MERKFVAIESFLEYQEEATSRIVTLNSLSELIEYICHNCSYELDVSILLKNQVFVKALQDAGFVKIEEIENRETKIAANKEFFVKENSFVRQVSMQSMRQWAQVLAKKDSRLLQTIDINSLKEIAPDFYKEYKKCVNRNKKIVEARAKKKNDNERIKKEKELEKAKKLLQEQGYEIKE